MIDPAVLAAAEESLGEPLEIEGRTRLGESGSTFVVRTAKRRFVLKTQGSDHRRLTAIVDRLRSAGYPAPAIVAAGPAFTLQEYVDGHPATIAEAASLVPEILAAVELQRGQGDLAAPPWPGWLLETIDVGGDGYCLHSTMRERPDTARLLDRLIALAERRDQPVRSDDLVHFDLNPANVLVRDGRLVAIVDWNVPFAGAAQGDRGFDAATLLFYLYDTEAREHLRRHCVELSGESWTAIYLAHLILRQVEWSLRRHPSSADTARYVDRARRLLDELQ